MFKEKGRVKEYKKEYYKLHREEILAKGKIYRERNKSRRKQYSEQYYELHKEEISQHRKEDRKKNREQRRQFDRTRHRKYRLTVGKKRIYGIIKRPYTGYCELCGKIVGEEIRLLDYHHWDDNDLKTGLEVKGVWVCHYCHLFCEAVDKDELQFIQRYLRLKRAINKEWKIKKEIKPELN